MDDKDRKIEALSLALQAYAQKLSQAHAEAVDLRVELTLERKKVATLEATIAQMNAPKADTAIAALTDFTPPT